MYKPKIKQKRAIVEGNVIFSTFVLSQVRLNYITAEYKKK